MTWRSSRDSSSPRIEGRSQMLALSLEAYELMNELERNPLNAHAKRRLQSFAQRLEEEEAFVELYDEILDALGEAAERVDELLERAEKLPAWKARRLLSLQERLAAELQASWGA
jgi:uncharacterized membrane protein YccC